MDNITPNSNTSKKKIIPIFSDYSGTINKLTEKEAKHVIDYFYYIKKLQAKFNCEAQIILLTGASKKEIKPEYDKLKKLAKKHHLPNLFLGVIAEYNGHLLDGNEWRQISEQIEVDGLSSLLKETSGEIDLNYTTYRRITFEKNPSTKEEFDSIVEKYKKLIENYPNYELRSYYDDISVEINIKYKSNSKSQAILDELGRLEGANYEFPYVFVVGDGLEDFDAYKTLKDSEYFDKSYFIASAPIEEFVGESSENSIFDDKHIISTSSKSSRILLQNKIASNLSGESSNYNTVRKGFAESPFRLKNEEPNK